MRMVAVSKMRKARLQAEKNAAYAFKMNAIVQALASDLDPCVSEAMELLHGNGKSDRVLLIAVSSDRGLCGSFNQTVIKAAESIISLHHKDGKEVRILCIGKKCYDALSKKFGSSMLPLVECISVKGTIPFAKAKEIASTIVAMFEDDKFDECFILYSRFKSIMSHEVDVKRLIPLQQDDECMAQHGCEFEPSEESIVENLLPKNFAAQLFAALLQSNASEQAARMTAMDNATRNSSEMISRLNLVYNRTRQAYITKELIEIISGAESV